MRRGGTDGACLDVVDGNGRVHGAHGHELRVHAVPVRGRHRHGPLGLVLGREGWGHFPQRRVLCAGALNAAGRRDCRWQRRDEDSRGAPGAAAARPCRRPSRRSRGTTPSEHPRPSRACQPARMGSARAGSSCAGKRRRRAAQTGCGLVAWPRRARAGGRTSAGEKSTLIAGTGSSRGFPGRSLPCSSSSCGARGGARAGAGGALLRRRRRERRRRERGTCEAAECSPREPARCCSVRPRSWRVRVEAAAPRPLQPAPRMGGAHAFVPEWCSRSVLTKFRTSSQATAPTSQGARQLNVLCAPGAPMCRLADASKQSVRFPTPNVQSLFCLLFLTRK